MKEGREGANEQARKEGRSGSRWMRCGECTQRGSRPSDKEGGHPGPEIRGRDGVPKKFFSALWASVWSKNRGGGPPGPSPGSTTGMND